MRVQLRKKMLSCCSNLVKMYCLYEPTLTLSSCYMWAAREAFLCLFNLVHIMTSKNQGATRQASDNQFKQDRKQRWSLCASFPQLRNHLFFWARLTEPLIGVLKHAKSGLSETVKHETGLLAFWHCVYTLAFWPYQHWSREVNNSARETDWEPMKHPYLPHSLSPSMCPHIQPSAYASLRVAASPPPSAPCHRHVCILSLGLVSL